MKLRTEDGAFVDSANPTLLRGWQWARLETGEDVLLAPEPDELPQHTSVRLGAGDSDVLTQAS